MKTKPLILAVMLVVIVVIDVGAGIATLAGLGTGGQALALACTTLVLVLLVLAIKWSVLLTGARGQYLLEGIEKIGLTDIEFRDLEKRPVPPTGFYEKAKEEVFVSGVSLLRTFQNQIPVFEDLLSENISVRLLLLHPGSSAVQRITEIDKRDVAKEIVQTIGTLRKNDLLGNANLVIKFMDQLPPYTAVMIDGDIENPGEDHRTGRGQIRIQPFTAHGSKEHGVVFQLKEKRWHNRFTPSPFEYYANDLRKQWKDDARQDPELLS